MFLRATTQPTWSKAFDALAMDTLMLAGSLLFMTWNPLNKDMMKDGEVDLLWKSAVTMILGMGAGMLVYNAIKGSIHCCQQQPEPANGDDYHNMTGDSSNTAANMA